MTAVTVNSNAYSDDGTQARDMLNGGHVTWFFPLISDTLVDLAAKVTAAQTAKTAAELAETNAETAEVNAETAASNAATSETNAAASAVAAANYAAALVGTSTTSLAIAVASKTFTTQASKQFASGQFVLAVSAADPTNYMFGQVTSYSGTTLIVDVQVIGGSGTHADWTISITGVRGAQGQTGATGTGITAETVGWTGTAGTTPKTLTVDVDFTMSNAASKAAANSFADNQQSRMMLLDCGYTVVDKGNSGTSTQTYDYTAGSVQTSTATGNHTIATSNWPPTGNLGELLIIGTNFGAYTITWPTISWLKPDGTTTTSISTYLAANTGRTAFQTSGVDQVLLWTRDAGTTIYGKLI